MTNPLSHQPDPEPRDSPAFSIRRAICSRNSGVASGPGVAVSGAGSLWPFELLIMPKPAKPIRAFCTPSQLR